jgi:hypothetical protein
MRVGVQRDAYIAMAQTLAYYLWVDALLEHQTGMGMAEVMQTDTSHPCTSQ